MKKLIASVLLILGLWCMSRGGAVWKTYVLTHFANISLSGFSGQDYAFWRGAMLPGVLFVTIGGVLFYRR
jgi:hypothetical protein